MRNARNEHDIGVKIVLSRECDAPPQGKIVRMDINLSDAAVRSALKELDTAPESPGQKRGRKKIVVADLFCGAGGFSTGAARAIQDAGHELVLSCVNHWPVAIQTHRLNHPYARHYCSDLASVRPSAVVPEGRLDLLMASPSCVYFSRARGAKPVSDQQRMDPWHIVTWLTELRVARLIVENVQEFMEWGPVNIRTGRPMESRKGEYFDSWVKTIRQLGFKVKWGVLNCADFGDATTRERFFLIARSDGRPLNLPVPTHSRTGSSDLFGAGARKWRSAAEVIDWSEKGKSIYSRKKSLSNKTLLRIYSGVVRFEWEEEYAARLEAFMLTQGVAQSQIDEVRHRSRPTEKSRSAAREFILNRHGENGCVRAHDVDAPMPTADCRGAGYLVERQPFIATVSHGNETSADNIRRVRPIASPLQTIHAGGGDFALVAPTSFVLSQAGGGTARDVADPVPAIVGAGAHALIAGCGNSGSAKGCVNASDPIDAIAAQAQCHNIASSHHEPSDTGTVFESTGIRPNALANPRHLAIVMPVTHAGELNNRTRHVGEPLPAVTGAHRGELGFCTAAFGEREGQTPRTHSVEEPVPTICAQGRINMVMPSTSEGDYDILFRMLQPAELSRATSMCLEDNPYCYDGATKTEMTKMIGNAVPAETAKALVAALLA